MAARTKVFVDIKTTTDGKEPGSGLKKFAIGAGIAAVAIAGLVKVGKTWSKAARDQAEIGSKFATIVRDISDDAEARADSFAEDFGLAGSSARELLGNTADLLTGFGLTQEAASGVSLTTNQLAADLASFSNAQGGAAAVSAALTSAYSGEREALKTYGIVINDAMIKAQLYKQAQEGLTFASEQQAKIAATLTLATEQSGNAIGDVSRTYESTANVMRRLGEAQKEFNEAMGDSVNRVITPFASAMADLIKQLADARIKTNELKEALDIVSEGGITSAKQTLLILESQRDKLGQIAAAYEGLDEAANKAWQNAIRQVEDYNESLGITDIFLDKAATTEERRNAAIEGNNDALVTYAQILKDAMTDEELRLIQVQKEIDDLVVLKAAAKDYGTEWSGIETLLIALIKEKNQLLLDEIPIIEEVTEAALTGYDDRRLGLEGVSNALIDYRNREKTVIEESKIDWEDLAETGLGAFAQAFKEVEEGNISLWEGFKEAGKDAVSALLEALAKMAIIEAALAAASFNFVSAGLFTAASAAAFAASGFVQSLATGGSFITDGPTMVGNNIIGDNASGQERVTVEPLGGGGDNGGGRQVVYFQFAPGVTLKGYMQELINTRQLHSSRGGAI